MNIWMVLHDPQEFGGLEEYAATLAMGLKQQGQNISVLSTTWVPLDNQYIKRLMANDVRYVQVPRWLSRPASHWATKIGILKFILRILSPITLVLAVGLLAFKRTSWVQSWNSANGWLGKKVFRLIGSNRYKPISMLLMNWWHFWQRPDVIHIQGYTSSLLFVIEWANKRKIPVVYEEHQTPDARFDWWKGFDQEINKATRVVAVSEKSAEALREVCGVTRPIVVRSPLLPDPLASGWHRVHENNDHNRVLKITTVARLVEAKGLDHLLEAIAKVRNSHPNVDFKVHGDGPKRQELLEHASRLGLDGESIFVGSFTKRDQLSSIMAETDIFVMSSVLEGQPLGVVEAMAYGCPIVATSVGGIPELIRDGINGLLCSPREPECLAKKIRTLLDDSSLREKLGRAARQSYEGGSYQPTSVSGHLLSIYQDAFREGTPG